MADEYPQLITEVQSDEKLVKMVTSKGNITIKLFPKYAPLAVENFLTHSENGYYDGVIFHRVIEGFMVQTGDPEGTGAGGESIYGERFEDEFSPALAHFRGALSMANAGPNTNGSQFFIVQSKSFQGSSAIDFSEEALEHYKQYGGTPHLDYRHTVFGHVIEGIDVVDAIAEVEVGQNDRPKEDITIETIELLN
ncbi:peptidylprolyl isomerase [Anaerobacillus alkalilacustris]|uniref:Peptidyl-prolyl cis-trans isomerase n=1 Tax=Anaerobacillus alkalilacustris TaxID=393763 RepID=A0A1S2LGR4_9BACI|nr:peptidylprolyl isomerase [Anaerobacillus alkalilacustris]